MQLTINTLRLFLYLQKTLRELFPTWDSIVKYQEVIRFACGISSDNQHVLDFAYETLLLSLVSDDLDRDDVEELMKSLCHEVSGREPTRVLNNEYINYVEEGCDIFVPSRFYVFDSDSEGVKLQVNQGFPAACEKAECIVNVNGSRKFLNVMKTIEEIYKYQEVEISSLNLDGVNLNHKEETRRLLLDIVHATHEGVDYEHGFKEILRDLINTTYQADTSNSNEHFAGILLDMWLPAESTGANSNVNQVVDLLVQTLAEESSKIEKIRGLVSGSLKLSRRAKMLRLLKCKLDSHDFLHLAEQLHGCEEMEKLHFTDTSVCTSDDLPVDGELGRALSTLSSLKNVVMKDCQLRNPMSEALLSGLGKCQNLVSLDLRNNTLTNCLERLFAGNDTGLPLLEQLYLEKTDLSEEDFININKAFLEGKLPKLKYLGLQENYLQGSMKILLGRSDGPMFPSLKGLWIQNTALSRGDIQAIVECSRAGQLPMLQHLNLSHNTLKDSMGILFDDNRCPAFPALTDLTLEYTDLSAADITRLSQAAVNGKLEKFEVLNLNGNKLVYCLMALFGDTTHPGFPSLEQLHLDNSTLNKVDVSSLSQAITSDKLPKLKLLTLKFNNLCSSERETEELIKNCVFQYKHRLHLELNENNLSEDFCTEMKSFCQDSNILLTTSTTQKYYDWISSVATM